MHISGLSRYNPIEHGWSPLSAWLAGVSLSNKLPGEDKPPAEQSGLSTEELATKEKLVFDNALKELGSYWNGKEYDGFPVEAIAVTSNDCPVDQVYNDYESVKKLFDASQRAIKADPTLKSLQEEFNFLMKHADRRPGMIIFRKHACMNLDSECFQTPIKAKRVFGKLTVHENYLFPTITRDPANPDHYMTFEQLLEARELSSAGAHFDTWRSFGSCKACRYVFSSAKDAQRHKAQIHGGKRTYDSLEPDVNEQREYVCLICDTSYPSLYMKYRHQQERGHLMDRGRPVRQLNLVQE